MCKSIDESTQASDPLNAFYDAMGLDIPSLRTLDGEDVPQPYRSLLVHMRDMTPTLEAYHGCTLELRLIDKRLDGDTLCRQVMLVSATDGKPAVYGAIRIFMNQFDAPARGVILECHVPLGSICARFNIAHHGRPSDYFAVEPDRSIMQHMGLARQHTLYGRHNELVKPDGGVLAQVVEILPPLAARPSDD